MTEAADGVEGAPEGARAAAPGSDPSARLVFALLVFACLAAFLITQRLKHTPTAIHEYKLASAFSPYPGGSSPLEAISFKLATADEVTVTILDSAGNTVATLVHDYPVARYKTLSLRWNGRRGYAHGYTYALSPRGLPIVVALNRGARAPAGEYRVRVGLRHHRPVLSPLSFTLVAP